MKLLKCIIRPNKVEEVREALSTVNVSGMTVSEVRGHGRQKGHKAIYRGREYSVTLLPKMMLDVVIPDDQVDQLMTRVKDTDGYTLTIDLNSCVLTDLTNLHLQFVVHEDPEIHEFRRHCLLNGLDEIGLTLEHESAITAYEQRAHDSN